MDKFSVHKKLTSAVILMVVSLSLMVTVSLAWFTLSTAPAVESIKLVIGGDNTIKIASNVQETIDGVTVNYPGFFDKVTSLNVEQGALLAPVSTADGVNWFVLNEEMNSSKKEMTSLDDFVLDNQYTYANSKDGGYIYVDFWIQSSLDNCILRLTSGDATGEEVGSYVVQLPSSVKNKKNTTGYSLKDSFKTLSSSVRVGFLVNSDTVNDNAVMTSYMNSTAYDENYKSLKGVYNSNSDYEFTIYEPNGLSHSNEGQSVILTHKGLEFISCGDGEYHITNPIGLNADGEKELMTIADRLIVQTENRWKQNDESLMIDDLYQGYLMSSSHPSLDDFYKNFLHDTYLPYVSSGHIFEDTWNLYIAGDNANVKSQEVLSELDFSNVNQASQIVRLKKNVPQRIRMFVWIEGQDIDCNYFAADKTIALRLELAGSSGE